MSGPILPIPNWLIKILSILYYPIWKVKVWWKGL